MTTCEWFKDVPWTNVPAQMTGQLSPAFTASARPPPKLLGGSSKLAKLAEERRRRAEATRVDVRDRTNDAYINTAMSSLDRLALSKNDETPQKRPAETVARKYPVKKKQEPTPPPTTEPEPEPEPEDAVPDLRATPSAFAQTLAAGLQHGIGKRRISLHDLFRDTTSKDVFEGPSPDDVVLKAHGQSKSLNK